MTVEQEVANLTAAVDSLKDTVVAKKATLDASVSDAQAATATATTAKTATLTARDEAGTHKDAAYNAAQSAASAVAYQDLTALAASKAVTAVDVFVYDTSKDSDGGAWRKRCQNTSWYRETLNTATRGSRREFPAVAVIVAEAGKVTIYDGDDPALPMWAVWTTSYFSDLAQASTIKAVAAMNGLMCIARAHTTHYEALTLFDLAKDTAVGLRRSTYNSGHRAAPSARPLTAAWVSGVVDARGIADGMANDVAITVLPGAPIDGVTGLPIPTIAVATDGGVSVIKDDGNVWDITASSYTLYATSVAFDGNDIIFQGDSNSLSSVSRITYVEEIPSSDVAMTGLDYQRGSADERYIPYVGGSWTGDMMLSQGSGAYNKPLAFGGMIAKEGSLGLTLLARNQIDPTKGMSAVIARKYNTGWMVGDIKGAWLSSTDTTSLVESGELVTNGTFDTDISGWNPATVRPSSAAWDASGYISLTASATQYGSGHYATLSTTVGKSYTVSADIISYTGSDNKVRVNTTTDPSIGIIADVIITSTGTKVFTFVATTATTYLHLITQNLTTPTVVADNISVRLADADRSVNSKGLIVNGTITRTPVATGADLVGYSGFSNSGSCLELPYNSDLDVGTGDFSIVCWFKDTAGVGQGDFIVDRMDAARLGPEIHLVAASDDKFQVKCGSSSVKGSATIRTGQWVFLALVRESGVLSSYVNGALDYSGANTQDVTNTSAVTVIGAASNGSSSLGSGSLAQIRISATAPSAEQIRKMYEDERPLFQPDAKAVLYGTSDAVTALAHDPDTGLLHVGTSAGRSDFDGLVRVNNTTTAVGTAISAANGLIVEE